MEDGKEYHSSDDKEDVKIPEEEDQDEDINEEDEEPQETHYLSKMNRIEKKQAAAEE